GWRTAGDGRRGRGRPPPTRSDGKRRVPADRELLGGPCGRARVPALHASGGVPRLARPGGSPLGSPRPDRRVAPRAEPREERHVSDWEREPAQPPTYGPLPPPDQTEVIEPEAPTTSPDGSPLGEAPPPLPAGKRSWNPVERLTAGLPRGWRIAIDWAVTIIGAIAIVLAIKAWVVNPYRIPSSSMEPTLHCARPGPGCEAHWSDRVLANRFIYHFRSPKRGEIIVFKTPPEAKIRCGEGGTFVKRLIGLPGGVVSERNGLLYTISPERARTPPTRAPHRRPRGPPPPRARPRGRRRTSTSSWATTAASRATPARGGPCPGRT